MRIRLVLWSCDPRSPLVDDKDPRYSHQYFTAVGDMSQIFSKISTFEGKHWSTFSEKNILYAIKFYLHLYSMFCIFSILAKYFGRYSTVHQGLKTCMKACIHVLPFDPCDMCQDLQSVKIFSSSYRKSCEYISLSNTKQIGIDLQGSSLRPVNIKSWKLI